MGVVCLAGDSIEGVLHLSRHEKNHRNLAFILEWQHVSADGKRTEKVFQNMELR
jgi:hypothetical protein